MADEVYLKREIIEDKPFEQHPNGVFGLVLVAVVLVIVGLVLLMPYVPVPELLLVVDMAVAAAAIVFIVRKNRKSNLSKSEAFVKRDGVLHYIALGFDLNNEDGINPVILALAGPTTAVNAMRASENMRKSASVNAMRQQEETFSALLDLILSAPLQRRAPHEQTRTNAEGKEAFHDGGNYCRSCGIGPGGRCGFLCEPFA